MDKLLFSDWAGLIVTLGVLVALISNLHIFREKGRSQVATDAELRSDVKHIREKVDKLDDLPGRMVKAEEGMKQMNRRLEHLETEKKWGE